MIEEKKNNRQEVKVKAFDSQTRMEESSINFYVWKTNVRFN